MLTRDEILARKTGKSKATLPDGGEVAVRALTRDEVLESQECATVADRENFIIATGMINPVMSIEDVHTWATTGGAGDLVAVSDRIAELSGLKQGADKSRVPDVRSEPGD